MSRNEAKTESLILINSTLKVKPFYSVYMRNLHKTIAEYNNVSQFTTLSHRSYVTANNRYRNSIYLSSAVDKGTKMFRSKQ